MFFVGGTADFAKSAAAITDDDANNRHRVFGIGSFTAITGIDAPTHRQPTDKPALIDSIRWSKKAPLADIK